MIPARPAGRTDRARRMRSQQTQAASASLNWKAYGYRIEIMYLRIDSPQLALRRIAARVKQGGNDVPREDVLRRFERSFANFQRIYRPLADLWAVYDNSGPNPLLVERGP